MGSRLDFRDGSSSEFLAGKSKEGDCRKIFFPPRERKVDRRIDFYGQVRGWKISLSTCRYWVFLSEEGSTVI